MADRRAVQVVLALVLLALTGVLTSRFPGDLEHVHSSGARIGEPVELDGIEVVVDRVQLAKAIATPYAPEVSHTGGGLWVAAEVTATSAREPLKLDGVQLRDDRGHRYLPNGLADVVDLPHQWLRPGLPMRGWVVFEVPADVPDGLVLVLGRADQVGVQESRSTAEVPVPAVEPVDRVLVAHARWG